MTERLTNPIEVPVTSSSITEALTLTVDLVTRQCQCRRTKMYYLAQHSALIAGSENSNIKIYHGVIYETFEDFSHRPSQRYLFRTLSQKMIKRGDLRGESYVVRY